MSLDKDSLINYRIERSRNTKAEAQLAFDNEMLNLTMNRIYYSAFYMISALAVKMGFSTSKHSQLKGWFNREFIKTKIVDRKFGAFFELCFMNRQESDYDDFVSFEKKDAEAQFILLDEFLDTLEELIKS